MEHITVLITPERYARYLGNVAIVRNNADYVVDFIFSEGCDFDPATELTAVFSTVRGIQRRTATGTSFLIPPMTSADGSVLKIGITQGNVMTTSYAVVPIVDSCLSGGGIDIDEWNANYIRSILGSFDETTDGLVPHTGEGSTDRVLYTDGRWITPKDMYPITYDEATFEEVAAAYVAHKLPVLILRDELHLLNHCYATEAEFAYIYWYSSGYTVELHTLHSNNEWTYREYDYYTSDTVDAKLRAKQDKLVLDPIPMEGSENFLTSGAVYQALLNLQNGVEPALDAGGNIINTASEETLVVQID